jgi:hypothetical protein
MTQFQSDRKTFKKAFGYFPEQWKDLLLATTGLWHFNIVQFDTDLSKADPEYNADKCLYKGKETSCSDYIIAKYGQEACDAVRRIMKLKDLREPIHNKLKSV